MYAKGQGQPQAQSFSDQDLSPLLSNAGFFVEATKSEDGLKFELVGAETL